MENKSNIDTQVKNTSSRAEYIKAEKRRAKEVVFTVDTLVPGREIQKGTVQPKKLGANSRKQVFIPIAQKLKNQDLYEIFPVGDSHMTLVQHDPRVLQKFNDRPSFYEPRPQQRH